MSGHLEDEVGGCTEPYKAKRIAIFHVCKPQRTVADCPGTEERRGLEIS